MESISASQFGSSDKDGLRYFLKYCQSRSVAAGMPYIASISRRVMDMDPLAVLRSIHESKQPHLYMEKRPVSVSGAESIVGLRVEGADRVVRAKEFVKDWSTRIISTGDLDTPFSGPLFFCAFSFDTNESGGGSVFMPKWQICRDDRECVAVANVLVLADGDIESEVERVWRAHQKFISMDVSIHGELPPIPVITERNPEPPACFKKRVILALEAVERGQVEKVVLSRWLDLQANSDLQPLDVLYHLREVYPECYAFSYSPGDESSWIGATPERLVRCDDHHFQTEAIAGSAPRGNNLTEDARLGRALLVSDKDKREHALVVDSILRRLKSLGLEPSAMAQPQLFRLSNVQHLKTPIQGNLKDKLHLLDLAEGLHPTPAVGGVPKEAAVHLQQQLECFPRGLYTGFLGWVNPQGDGEIVVALRTAHIRGQKARLYAGAGIVSGSEPDREFQETEYKLQAMLSGLERK